MFHAEGGMELPEVERYLQSCPIIEWDSRDDMEIGLERDR